MICKDCVFYTGIKCHGHGDFWGECKLISIFIKCNNLNYHDYDIWKQVKDDNTKCFFNDILKLKQGGIE